ncbi:hypothetical protein U5640_16960 [Streptomyces sp. SS7]|uniref:hypothetical protein n=1 Tax=Streptomyces sp. SS7 TaxID=3108485 RepID=UPI0030ED0E1C
MPVYFLPSTREEDEWAAYMMKDRNEPCWLCKRERRKTLYGYMCWECQEQKPVWQAHLDAINKAEGERRERAYKGYCYSCAKTWVEGTWECEPCRAEWRA